MPRLVSHTRWQPPCVLSVVWGMVCAVGIGSVGQAQDAPLVATPLVDPAQQVTAEKAVATAAEPALPPAPDTLELPVASHPWGRFDVGAWRTLRTVTETFDENGKFLTRSETLHTDTLTEVTDESYTLETTSVVEVGGKRLRGATQVTRRSLLTDHTSQAPIAVEHPAVDISLCGKTIPCQQWELTYGEGAQRRIETLFYAPEFPPNVMRREVSAPDGSSAADLTSEVTSVLAVDVPILLEGGMVAGYRQQVRATAGANQIERTELLCALAPGGLVEASSTERDASGRRVRWVVTELEDFGDAQDAPQTDRRWRLFRRPGR